MPEISQPVAIPCPRCSIERARVVVLTRTVITLTCLACGHGWSVATAWLPDDVRGKIAPAS